MTRPPHQIIYTHGGGRLGNQVLRFVHWMAWAQAQGGEVEVVNLAFWPYASLFAHWSNHPGCVFPPRRSGADRWARRRLSLPQRWRETLDARTRLGRAVQRAGDLLPGCQAVGLNIAADERLELDDPEFLRRVRATRVTTCAGWQIATWSRVGEQESALRSWFKLAPEVAAPADAFIAGLRQKFEVLIGVLIRQSDYRAWNDGRFWFSTAQYARWMEEARALHSGRRVGFVIASEVRQDPAAFADLPVVFATGSVNTGGPAAESWAELAQCDVILTPPSTFSATAAFLGAVPVWPVVRADQTLHADQVVSGGLAELARHPEFSRAVK